MQRVFILICFGWLSACSSHPTNNQANNSMACFSADCIRQQTQQQLSAACTNHLFFYPRSLRTAIDQEYRYPLTNFDSYSDWLRMGNMGPHPKEWCDRYAAHKVQNSYPTRPQ